MLAAVTPHPSAEELRAYGEGRLAPTAAAAVERHIAACDSCCRLLEGAPADSFVDRLRDARRPPLGNQPVLAPFAIPVVPAIPPALIDHPRYRVLGLIGQGGMGAVYRAEHRHMERPVALKVINPALMCNPATVERFRQEVRTAARLHHPNIVTAYDADQAGNPPLHFLVMEYVEGQSLADLVRERGPLPIAEACEYVRQAALGLQHAHEQGMVHRDVKPHNLMRTPAGQIKILDFGLARLARTPGHFAPADTVMGSWTLNNHPTLVRPVALTGAGTVMGTADYIAPEQAVDPRAADIRADIYALGCTLYFLLAGRPPFPEGSDQDKIARHATNPLPPLPDLPPGLAAVLARMTAKTPADRFATPAEVAGALASFVGAGEERRQRSRKGRLITAGLLLVALIACIIVIRIEIKRGDRPAQTEQDKNAARTAPPNSERKRDTQQERPVTDQGPTYKGKTLGAWIAQLHAKDDKTRDEAATLIIRVITEGPIRDKIRVPQFTPAVNDPNGTLLPALAHAFRSKEELHKGLGRRDVASHVLRLYGEKAVPVFTDALKDQDAEVRADAVQELHGLITGQHFGVRTLSWQPLRPAVVKSLTSLLGQVLLKDKEMGVRSSARAVLLDIGRQEQYATTVLEIFLVGLKSADNKVREDAVHALSGMGAHARKAVPALAKLLKDEDPHFRWVVANCLSSFAIAGAAGEAVPALIETTKNQDSSGKEAVNALRNVGKAPQSMVPALLALLKDPEPNVQLWCVKFLCNLGEGDKECLAVLLKLIKRRDASMRQEVVRLLRCYGPAAKDAVPALIEIVRNDSSQIRVYALGALGNIGPAAKAAIPALKGLEKQYQKDVSLGRPFAEMRLRDVQQTLAKIEQ